MNTKLKDIITDIYTMNAEDINVLVDAIKMRRNQLAKQTTRIVRRGDKVEFDSKYGGVTSGTVTKVNQKTIVIDCGSEGNWKVSASMVRLVETA